MTSMCFINSTYQKLEANLLKFVRVKIMKRVTYLASQARSSPLTRLEQLCSPTSRYPRQHGPQHVLYCLDTRPSYVFRMFLQQSLSAWSSARQTVLPIIAFVLSYSYCSYNRPAMLFLKTLLVTMMKTYLRLQLDVFW